jgi:hypothetical protein
MPATYALVQQDTEDPSQYQPQQIKSLQSDQEIAKLKLFTDDMTT